MRRIRKRLAGLILAGMSTLGLPARGAETVKPLGIGAAYDQIGKVAVMHEGRVKPLDTVAREEVKQVYSRETIALREPREEVEKLLNPESFDKPGGTNWSVEKWGPVGAFLGWTIRPEFWDDQPFILVDYLPLRRLIVAGPLEARLKAIADKPGTSAEDKARLQKLAADRELVASTLIESIRASKLPIEDRRAIAELAAKLTEEHKWLTPHELDEAKIDNKGETLPFLAWAGRLGEQQRKFHDNPLSAERPTEIERRIVEVAQRLMSYRAYSGEDFRTNGLILILPRPSDAKYLAFTTKSIAAYEGAQAKGNEDLPLMKLDALKALGTYWNFIPREEHKTPAEDAAADARFTAWLRESSTWVPLKVLLKSKPEELIEAGYPEGPLNAFLAAYHNLEQAETHSPGQVSEAASSEFLSASRALGDAVSSAYPSVASIERETYFNATNPFWKAPFAYGFAVMLLVVGLAFVSTTARESLASRAGRAIYRAGMLGLLTGIALEIWGFYFRVRITGWAPVTNMYETVIWVSLVAAVLSVIFEVIYGRVYFALAGSAVALLGTITAANVPLLDPSIKSLQPVLRSNLWLTIHVLTEVSSYAAFGLAWMLGLIATAFYMTATYRRSPRLGELVLPLIPGLPLLTVGAAGVAASYGYFGPEWTTGDPLFYFLSAMGLIGGMISLAAVLSIGGELVARLTFREEAEREEQSDGSSWQRDGGSSGQSALATSSDKGGGVATLIRPSVAEIRARAATTKLQLDARGLAMQRTAAVVKPLSNFIYRTMQVGVLLIAAGTILGGVWADYSWGRFWGWDAKEVWALITLLVYLIPLHGRFAGWVNTFGLVFASVFCFLSVVMAWYGVNFVLGVGLHSYGFVEGGSQGAMLVILAGILAFPLGAAWRRQLGYRPMFEDRAGASGDVETSD
jgi:ABC-type transport system involved in cytochrome c biogenesis permease subunit